jgi:Cu/Ag efflux protein CusF
LVRNKKMNVKKWLIALIILILATVALVAILKVPKPKVVNTNNGGSQDIKQAPSVYSTNGTVKQIEGSAYTITLADGKTVKTFNLTAGTEIVKRVTASNGKISLAADKLSSVGIGSQIVVYSKGEINGQSASQVIKVEIIK